MPKKLPETNPFVQNGTGFKIEAIWKMEELVPNGAKRTSEYSTAGATTFHAYKYERDDRVAVYTKGILGMFSVLSSAAKDMMMFIASRIQYDSDVIELEEDRYCKIMNVSRSTFFAAKKELTNRLIIPRTSRKNTYWINPMYLFKGNRLEKYPESVVMVNNHPMDRAAKSEMNEETEPYSLD